MAGLLVPILLPALVEAAIVGVDADDVAPPPVAGLGSCNHLTCVAGPYLCNCSTVMITIQCC